MYPYHALSINLSKLDFKCFFQSHFFHYLKTINLSKLDFKFIFLSIKENTGYSINLSKLDFKYFSKIAEAHIKGL